MLTNEQSFRGVLSDLDTVGDNSVMKYPNNLKINSASDLDACNMSAKFDFVTNPSFPDKSIIMKHVDDRIEISWGFD
jgi:hypothetical protein